MTFGASAWWGTRLIVVGSGSLAARTHADLAREPQWGLRPVGFVDDASMPGEVADSPHCLGTLERLDRLAASLASIGPCSPCIRSMRMSWPSLLSRRRAESSTGSFCRRWSDFPACGSKRAKPLAARP